MSCIVGLCSCPSMASHWTENCLVLATRDLLTKHGDDINWCGISVKNILALLLEYIIDMISVMILASALLIEVGSVSLVHVDWTISFSSNRIAYRQSVKAIRKIVLNVRVSLSPPLLKFLCTAESRTAVTVTGCCGWLSRTSFVYVFWFNRLWWVSVKDSLCSSLICDGGGKFSFGIWVHTTWKPHSQHFISEWGQTHSHFTQRLYTYTQTLTHWQRHAHQAHTHAPTHKHTHILTQFGPA